MVFTLWIFVLFHFGAIMVFVTLTRLRLYLPLLAGFLGLALQADAQTGPRDFAGKLQSAGVIDTYWADTVAEVAGTLIQAAPSRWQGAQVNHPYRKGWVNIYLIDARRLPEGGLLQEDGVDNLTPANLSGGAMAHEDSGTIFVNTGTLKRLAAATVLTQTTSVPNLTAALATVDVMGLDAARKLWSPETLAADTSENDRARWLMRGVVAFILAHEMGHLQLGRPQLTDDSERQRVSHLTAREMDEMAACPDLLAAEWRQRQQNEAQADKAAAALLGQQCKIGSDGEMRHSIYVLGTSWYFTAAVADKMIVMGRNTDSQSIATMLKLQMGPDLYQKMVAANAAERRRGAVRIAYPSSHPPDMKRIQAVNAALANAPCGNDGLASSDALSLELFRVQMCKNFARGTAP